MRIAELFAEKIAEGKQVITVSGCRRNHSPWGSRKISGLLRMMRIRRKNGTVCLCRPKLYMYPLPRRLFRDPDNKLLGGGSVRAGRLFWLGYHIGTYLDDNSGICSLLPDDYPSILSDGLLFRKLIRQQKS